MVKSAGKIKKMNAVMVNAVKKGLIISGYLVAQRATRRAPRDTGRLKRSILAGKPYKRSKSKYAIDVGTNVEYAAAQELGSGEHAEGGGEPYDIVPVKKKALAFFWPDAPANVPVSAKTGKVVLAKVTQRGVKPQPYLRPALEESADEIKGILLASILAGLKKM
jgi:HK97 gp10 family phage protein